ncbi:hypothetical protein HGB13_01990 [bacterium]|nr:hypothetical protein [bacterium]
MSTQEVKEVKEEAKPEKTNQPSKVLSMVQEEAKNIFSLQNLTVSLLSALLVIGIGYGSSFVTEQIQGKFYSNPTMYTIFTVTIFAAYLWAIVGPALIYCTRTKKWNSLPYILLFEIIWFVIFITVLFFTTPEKANDMYQYLQ